MSELSIDVQKQKGGLANVAVDDGDADWGEDYQGEDEESPDW